MRCFRRYSDLGWDLAAVTWILFVYASAVLGWRVGWDGGFAEYMAGLLAVAPLHEAIHAAVLYAIGYGASIGVGREGWIPVAYTRPSAPVEREKYLVFAAAPFFAMHVFPLWGLFQPLPTWARALYLWNTAGCGGDVLAFLSALRLPPKSVVRDTGSGFEDCMPDPLPGAWRAAVYLAAAALTLGLLLAAGPASRPRF